MHRYDLKVPPEWFDYAISHGAQFDPERKTFYTIDDIPEPLERFAMERVKRESLPHRPSPTCACGRRMVLRASKRGDHFWGCSGYPKCISTRPFYEDPVDFLGVLKTKLEISQSNPQMARPTKHQVLEVALRAQSVLGKERVEEWLFTPNELTEMQSPAEAMKTYLGYERVRGVLNAMALGHISIEKVPDK